MNVGRCRKASPTAAMKLMVRMRHQSCIMSGQAERLSLAFTDESGKVVAKMRSCRRCHFSIHEPSCPNESLAASLMGCTAAF